MKRQCFLIGQMSADSDMHRMECVKSKLLEPILEPLGYEVETADSPKGSADIFKFVMQKIDTVDLLVADLTNNNANVYYELAVRQALGLPYVLISEGNLKFDICTLRCFMYRLDELNSSETRKRLEVTLKALHTAISDGDDIDNPITNFYGTPLAEVSPASGLGLGYYRNFVRFSMKDIREGADKVVINGQALSNDIRQSIQLEIWIPSLLKGAYHQNIVELLVKPGKLSKASIHKDPREFPLYSRTDSEGNHVLVDIPTALNAMEVAISGRYSQVRLNKQNDEWKRLEQQEIERFKDTVKRLLGNETDVVITDNVHICDWELP